jgi:HAD superfamily hydrolase (TIGR01509 family)
MRAMEKIQLVIFDCDGVLVDSEIVGNAVLAEVITEQGWTLSLQETLRRFKGRSMVEIWQEVGARVGRPITDAIDRDFRARQLRALGAQVKAVQGAEALLDALPVPCCVASNGPHEKMQTTLGATGLLSRFEGRRFSRVDVPRPKPHPDLFLHAAQRMGADAAACLVVEDSTLGIEAAHRAGMRAVGFAGTVTADASALHAAGAEQVLLELGELLPLLR